MVKHQVCAPGEERVDDDFLGGWNRVEFDVVARYELANPSWLAVTREQVERLVGGRADADRGAGYVPRAPLPQFEPRYEVAWVVSLPTPRPFHETECMPVGVGFTRRIARQLRPPRGRLGTRRWYHAGDWHRASALAIELVDQARRAEVAPDDISDHVLSALKARRLDSCAVGAVESLVCPAFAISARRRWPRKGYVNGQHRAQAMLEAGVQCTITVGSQRKAEPSLR